MCIVDQNLKYTKDSSPQVSVTEKAGDIILIFEATNKNVNYKFFLRLINILIMAAMCHFYFIIVK